MRIKTAVMDQDAPESEEDQPPSEKPAVPTPQVEEKPETNSEG